jgi:surface antigen
MRKSYINVISMLIIATLTACSTTVTRTVDQSNNSSVIASSDEIAGTPEVQQTPALASVTDSNIGGTSIGGAVERAMDEADRSKMMHAMDKAPGKSTHWVNANTQIEYTVTPVRKVRIEDKNYCRQYQMTAVDTNEREQNVQGVACIASDGNWHILET